MSAGHGTGSNNLRRVTFIEKVPRPEDDSVHAFMSTMQRAVEHGTEVRVSAFGTEYIFVLEGIEVT